MFGLRVSPGKCVSNIDEYVEGRVSQELYYTWPLTIYFFMLIEFSWLGYNFNTDNLDVYLDIPKIRKAGKTDS